MKEIPENLVSPLSLDASVLHNRRGLVAYHSCIFSYQHIAEDDNKPDYFFPWYGFLALLEYEYYTHKD